MTGGTGTVPVQEGRTAIPDEHVDVLIVGAGLSGIAAAWHLKARHKRKAYAILERRGAIGGTWDLFRYPGVRSDSDMHTLGYSFRPWPNEVSISDGASIAAYVADTAAAAGIDRHIRFRHKVVRAAWSSARALWNVDALRGPQGVPVRFTCRFLFMCSGYYDYDAGHLPHWPDMDRFAGTRVHPQHWPTDLAYGGKRVVVIGSGATAVTLVPALAETAAHVTMLQRSPTYIVARPARDPTAARLYRRLPKRLAHRLVRWKNLLLGMYFYNYARRHPERTKAGLIAMAHQQIGPDFDAATHLTPSYAPWDQRLCLVPDGDLFAAIRAGKASIVTDEIERFIPTGLALRSGRTLEADVIVTATGLKLGLMGSMEVAVDGQRVDFGQTMAYKGMMFSGVPNFALAMGYVNASWTLKAELSARYVCRLLAHMDAKGFAAATPRWRGAVVDGPTAFALTSGYIKRAAGLLPKQGDTAPWRVHQNYARDLVAMRLGAIDDGAVEFTPARAPAGIA
ncbi:flavin-containing monooxygenase [Chelatococcus reniformis]|uniref:Monooxygenase n=1 Tax=Chelatococcus reniformis TaxID=1494448 RepID=A0A916X841_9HYPH|nr:NAD(P)/FAD-dependent oxidoreductase [Chelatococcus reniformis]GGC53657.1 monooxygenase [Chelatococcus reniformis]